jgi:dinuclear metal center YbgI/SA1388 family protein
MSAPLSRVISEFDKLWPIGLAESWDEVGLVSGSLNQSVSKVLLTVDVTHEVIQHAKDSKVDLILAHHPLLLRGVTALPQNSSKGSAIAQLIGADIALYSAHTNADSVGTGTSAVLANAIGLKDSVILAPSATQGFGIGIIGSLEQGISLGDLASKLSGVLPQTATGVRVAGDFDRVVNRVALCAGAGDSYLELALDSGADVYITSDLRHHRAQEVLEEAKARGAEFSLIDISHWAAEYLWLEQAVEELAIVLPDLEFEVCDIRTDVFDFLMNNQQN